ncbi:hypothetical protein [Reyranella sp.]|uniref:hypothetical protein n=1 Tax=Reyranella sp. TaxID=1929291 RepID=UPI003F70293C
MIADQEHEAKPHGEDGHAVEEADDSRAERSQFGRQVALRSVADGLRRGGEEGEGNPEPGRRNHFPDSKDGCRLTVPND